MLHSDRWCRPLCSAVSGDEKYSMKETHLIAEDDPSFCECPRKGDTMLVRCSNICQAVEQVHGVARYVACSLRRVSFDVPFKVFTGYTQNALRKRRICGTWHCVRDVLPIQPGYSLLGC